MNEGIRINKFLSEAGVCSRRDADRLIEEGRVTIGGVPAGFGFRVKDGDEVFVNGKPVMKSKKRVVLAYHKPVGIVCTTRDPKSKDKNIIEAIRYKKRVFPIGRLDKDSEGLILLSDDGDLSDKIMKARNYHEKEYQVKVDKHITEEFLEKMGSGVPILGRLTRPCKVWKISEKGFGIILTEGLNRQIRRMCEYLGYKVTKLKRVRIMEITLGNLKYGEYRELSEEEYERLWQGVLKDEGAKRSN